MPAPGPGNRPCPRRGAALMVVLVTLLALAPSVFSLLDTSYCHTREPTLLANEYQAGVLAAAGVDLALNLLRKDEDSLSDTPGEPWCGGRPGIKGQPLPVWNSRGLTVTVIPCNAYLNLNTVIFGKEPTPGNPNEQRRRMEKALASIFLKHELPPTLVPALQDWIDQDRQERLPGAEGFAYSGADKGYVPSNAALVRTEEALLVAGWGKINPDWLRARVTAWGDSEPKLNVNFAPVEVLEALVPELVPYRAQIVAFRDSQGFKDVSQIVTVTGMDEETYAKVAPYLTVLSDHLQVLVRAEVGTWVEVRRYIVERKAFGGSPKVVCGDVLFTGAKR